MPSRLSNSELTYLDSILVVSTIVVIAGEDDPVMIDISYFTTAKILDKRSSPSGVEYRCELEVACRVGERGAGGKRSRPELRKWRYTSTLSGDIEG